MKKIPISFGLLLIINTAFSQSPCSTGVRIQSAVVSKPTEVQSTPTSNCTSIRVNWKGNANNTYIISGTYIDNSTNATTTLTNESPIVCDNDQNCSILLPLKPGNKLSWTIQTVAVVDGRTFYSYPLYGEYAGCDEDALVVKTTNAISTAKPGINKADEVSVKSKFTVYPNPASGELLIKWSGVYKGNAKLTIMDAAGKAVKLFNLQKSLPEYLDRIAVNSLSPGLYFIQIKTNDGKSLTTRFMKN